MGQSGRLAIIGVIAAGIAFAVWWRLQPWYTLGRPSSNAIMVIQPYWYNGTWVFDDPAVGLRREPFVAGVPKMIDHLVKDIPNARDGFLLYFSAQPFPDHQKRLTWLRSDGQGNWYRLNDPPIEGWLCPALFKYYATPPAEFYVKAEPKSS